MTSPSFHFTMCVTHATSVSKNRRQGETLVRCSNTEKESNTSKGIVTIRDNLHNIKPNRKLTCFTSMHAVEPSRLAHVCPPKRI